MLILSIHFTISHSSSVSYKTLIAVLLMKFMLGTVRKREKEAYEAIANHPDTLLELVNKK